MNDEPFLRDDEDRDGFNPEDLNFDEEEDFFPVYYDLETVFDEKIHPLLKTIVNICNEYNLPMVASFQYANSKNNVMLCTSVVNPPKRRSKKLAQATNILLN